MPGAYLYGWEQLTTTTGVWHKLICNNEGKLIIDPSEIFENDPHINEHGKAPDSDWAYDHENTPNAHHPDNFIKTTGVGVWVAATEGRDYPAGFSIAYARTGDGWPSTGTVLTAKGLDAEHDGSVMQLYIPYGPGYGGIYTKIRFGREVTDGWSDWQDLGYDAPALIAAHEAKVNMKIGLFQRNTSLPAGTQTIAGIGFQPSCVDLYAVIPGTGCVSMGFDDGINHYCVLNQQELSSDKWSLRNNRSVYMVQSETKNYVGKVDSFNADGFVYQWYKSSTPAGLITVYYKARRY